MQKPCVILPLDNFPGEEGLRALEKVLSNESAKALISHVKLNDAVHGNVSTAPALLLSYMDVIEKAGSKAKIFLDLKLADTWGTVRNTLSHYKNMAPDILTMRSSCSLRAFVVAKSTLPNTKLALVSALTDMSREEHLRRYALSPEEKIHRDMRALCQEAELQNYVPPFDMVVCSPLELTYLIEKWEDTFEYVVPGIRDEWMSKGQQERSTGIKEALDLGATNIVAGSQMLKGNLKQGVNAEQSRQLSIEQINKSWRIKLDPTSFRRTLVNLEGYYESAKENGRFKGPLVMYAGQYKDELGEQKNYVGTVYLNLAKIENKPKILHYYARVIANKINANNLKPDVIAGVPTGGNYWGEAVAKELQIDYAHISKVKIRETDGEKGQREDSRFDLSRHELKPGDKVVIVEDLCNTFSSTEKVREAIKKAGGDVIGIACAFNRSTDYQKGYWKDLPIIAIDQEAILKYKQDDEQVADLLKAGKIVPKPKDNWEILKEAMNA
ncbi:MAG: orotidine 5'-phosphate decarboxylase / HUMPS family protein [Parcubacteria group bacterium]